MRLAIEVFICFVMKKIIYIHLNIFKRISNHNLHFFNFWRYSIQCATMILQGFTICLYICWLPAMVSVIIFFLFFSFSRDHLDVFLISLQANLAFAAIKERKAIGKVMITFDEHKGMLSKL